MCLYTLDCGGGYSTFKGVHLGGSKWQSRFGPASAWLLAFASSSARCWVSLKQLQAGAASGSPGCMGMWEPAGSFGIFADQLSHGQDHNLYYNTTCFTAHTLSGLQVSSQCTRVCAARVCAVIQVVILHGSMCHTLNGCLVV